MARQPRNGSVRAAGGTRRNFGSRPGRSLRMDDRLAPRTARASLLKFVRAARPLARGSIAPPMRNCVRTSPTLPRRLGRTPRVLRDGPRCPITGCPAVRRDGPVGPVSSRLSITRFQARGRRRSLPLASRVSLVLARGLSLRYPGARPDDLGARLDLVESHMGGPSRRECRLPRQNRPHAMRACLDARKARHLSRSMDRRALRELLRSENGRARPVLESLISLDSPRQVRSMPPGCWTKSAEAARRRFAAGAGPQRPHSSALNSKARPPRLVFLDQRASTLVRKSSSAHDDLRVEMLAPSGPPRCVVLSFSAPCWRGPVVGFFRRQPLHHFLVDSLFPSLFAVRHVPGRLQFTMTGRSHVHARRDADNRSARDLALTTLAEPPAGPESKGRDAALRVVAFRRMVSSLSPPRRGGLRRLRLTVPGCSFALT